MTNEEAQKRAPSYLHLPDDGDLFRCSICEIRKPHYQMIKPFTPDKVNHMCECLSCIDLEWLENAQDCGIAE